MPMPTKARKSDDRDGEARGMDPIKPVRRKLDRVLMRGNGMEYRRLGVSGLKVSPLCLGTMMFGGETDEIASARIVARAGEQGVNFIDTADGYNGGRSEEVPGRAIREH